MNKEYTSIVEPELKADECLLWSDQPKQGLLFWRSERLFTFVSYLWGGGWIYWEYYVCTYGYSLKYKLWGIPFVLLGLYAMFGRFWIDAWERRHTYYALTNVRILIIRDYKKPFWDAPSFAWIRCIKDRMTWTSLTGRVTSLPLTTLPQMYCLLEPLRDRGTIIFGMPSLSRFERIYQFGKPPPPPCFELIKQPNSVYQLIQEAQTHVFL